MKLPGRAERIRIFIGEKDHHGGKPLFQLIVEEARKRGLAGATVIRGISGFGANSRVKTAKILLLSEDLPLIVEIVDAPERVAPFLDWLDGVMQEGLVTREEVEVVAYRHSHGKKTGPA